MLDVPQELLDSRRQAGADRWDEIWDGELHMVPPPSWEHQEVAIALLRVLAPLAERRGLIPRYETGLFRPGADSDFRVPDQVYAAAELATARGFEGPASLVVEIRSPHDETYSKLDWYGSLGVAEVLVIEPHTRHVELFALTDGRMVPVEPGDEGVVIRSLGVRATTVDDRLHLMWEGGSAQV